MWKEEVVDYFKNCTYYLKKTTKYLRQDSHSPGQNGTWDSPNTYQKFELLHRDIGSQVFT
jgi:hypothetical protein